MKSKHTVSIGLVICLGMCISAAAQPAAEKTAKEQTAVMPTYDISLFSHEFHVNGAGFICTDCHDSIFQAAAGSAKAKGDFNMASFGQGKYCGACHDGSTAFAVDDQDSCARCHGTDMKPSADVVFEQSSDKQNHQTDKSH